MFLIWSYRVGVFMLLPLWGAYFLYRLWKKKEDLSRIKERFGCASQPRPKGKLVWIHCASVGESISILPLVEVLIKKDIFVLVTSGTRTSAKVLAQKLPYIHPQKAVHQFVPIDFWPFVAKFMHHWKPDVSVFVESEFWTELLYSAPTPILINGRISENSFKAYKKFSGHISNLLRCFELALAQTQEDAHRLKKLGAQNVKVGGNLKFDAKVPAPNAKVLAGWQQWKNKPVLLAASTHPGEEEQFAALFKTLKKQFKNLVLLVVPRHPERGPEVVKKLQELGCEAELRTLQPHPAADVYVADTIGELALWYSLASVAVVGGSFVRHGGQNPLEPVKLGTCTLCGPHMFNFTEMVDVLKQKGLLQQVESMKELEEILPPLLAKPAKVDHTRLNSLMGATNAAAKEILKKLS